MTMLIDVSIPLTQGMLHFPGEPGPTYDLVKALGRGDPADVSSVTMAVHSGTHVDAPCHFIPGAGGVDSIPPDACIGPCRVLEIPGDPHVSADALEAVVGAAWPERILLRTRNSSRQTPCWNQGSFTEDFAALAPDAAALMVERGVRLVGIDYLSMEPFGVVEPTTHLTLLGAGVVILEGLDLRRVDPGDYELICLPALMPGLDGAPARTMLRTS